MFWTKTRRWTAVVMPLCAATVASVLASVPVCEAGSDIDDQHKFAWAENLGWTNWRDAEDGDAGVVVSQTYLAGFIWAENVGWINTGDGSPAEGVHYANLDGTDFGVNLDAATGDLFGLAWGENIGWINFETSSLGDDRARFDSCERRFFGYVWGENVGWMNLDDLNHFVAVCACGDYDCDSDVDLDDFAVFGSCLGGPNVAAGCLAFDSDCDGDVDLRDFAAFQNAFNAP